MFSYSPGDTLGEPAAWPAWVWSEELLSEVANWMRGLHEATLGWQPPPDARWFSGRAWSPGLVIGHQDAAPWNVAVRDDHLVGLSTQTPSAPQAVSWTSHGAP